MPLHRPTTRLCAPTPALLIVAASLLASCASPPATAPSSTTLPRVAPPAASSGPASGPLPAASDTPADAQAQAFAAWVAAFRTSAAAAGIGPRTLDRTLGQVRYLPRLIELDRSQPEFTRSVWDYLDRTVTESRIARGREMLQRVRAEASASIGPYPVPPEIVVAVWGMESNYGGNVGDTPTIDALATLGFEGRRADWARGELLAALRIVERGDIEPGRMIGSWAGAMGQTQFLPSSYLSDAVDADGDGRRDIWDSLPDVVASTANHLARSGWQAQQPWGVEVSLPKGFDHGRADPAVRQSATRWSDEGVRAVDGTPLPDIADASVLLPAGARGPAFLVGPNFRAILRYNNSTSYALAVGLLSRRIVGGSDVQAPWPRDLRALARSEVVSLQEALSRRGFDSGAPDGAVGPATRAAVRAFQRSAGLPADGFPTVELLERLREP